MITHKTISYQEFVSEYKDKEFIVGYDKDEFIILIYKKDHKTRVYLTIPDFEYYFCVKTTDVKEHDDLFDKLKVRRKIERLEEEGSFTKVYVRTTNRYGVRDNKDDVLQALNAEKIVHYEADLSPYQRLIIDHKLDVATKYRTLFFDIETDDRGKGIVIGERRIVSIAAVDDEKKVFYWTGDEADILNKFFKKIQHYDLITGWNSEKFDIPYIRARAKKLKAQVPWYNWRQTLQVDMMQKMMEIHKRNVELIKEVRSFSLNAISKHFLGDEKIEHEESIWELFTKNPEKLKKYNIQDCALLYKLEDKLKIIGQKIAEHRISGCFLNEFAVSRILDVYILKNAVGTGIRFKSKPPRDLEAFNPNKKSGYVGGLVFEPVKGLHYNVFHFDFTSLYPSIIRTFNISPETWDHSKTEEEKQDFDAFVYSPNAQAFARAQGIIPRTIAYLLDARNKIRYEELPSYKEGSLEYEAAYFKQYAFKTIANSFYGILGASFTRYYRKETAEAITMSGHYMLRLVEKWCHAKGIQVLYGDTDSVFVKADYEMEAEKIHREINHYIAFHSLKHFGVTDSYLDLKVEAIYDSTLFVSKKKYVKNEGGKLKISGLEAKRRETLPFTAKKQVEMLEMLMLNDATEEEMQEWILNLREYVLSGKMKKEEVMLQIKLSKHADEYRKVVKDKKTKEPILDDNGKEQYKPSALAHIKVAVKLQERGIKENNRNTWEKGSYIKYIITDGSKKLQAESIYDYKEGSYDPEYYWDVKIYSPLVRVLDVVFPKHNWGDYLMTAKVRRAHQKEYDKANEAN